MNVKPFVSDPTTVKPVQPHSHQQPSEPAHSEPAPSAVYANSEQPQFQQPHAYYDSQYQTGIPTYHGASSSQIQYSSPPSTSAAAAASAVRGTAINPSGGHPPSSFLHPTTSTSHFASSSYSQPPSSWAQSPPKFIASHAHPNANYAPVPPTSLPMHHSSRPNNNNAASLHQAPPNQYAASTSQSITSFSQPQPNSLHQPQPNQYAASQSNHAAYSYQSQPNSLYQSQPKPIAFDPSPRTSTSIPQSWSRTTQISNRPAAAAPSAAYGTNATAAGTSTNPAAGASTRTWSTGSMWQQTPTSMWQRTGANASTFNSSAVTVKPFSFSGSGSQPKPGKMDWFEARSRPQSSNFGRVITSSVPVAASSSSSSSSGAAESAKRRKKNPVQSENGKEKDPPIALLSLPADQAAQALRNPKAGKACKVLEPDVVHIIKCLQEWAEVWTPLWTKCETVLFGDMQVNKLDLRLLFSRRMPARPAAKSITAVLQGILAHDGTSPTQQALLLDVRSFWTGIRFRPDCKEKIEDEIKLAKADEVEREKSGMPASNRRKGKRISNGGDTDDVSAPSTKLLWDISCIQNQYVVRVLCGLCDVRAILMDRKAIVAWERHCIQFTGTYIPVPTLPPSNVLRSMGIDLSTVDSKTIPAQFSPGPHQSVQLDFCIPLPKDAIVDPKTHTAVSIGDPDGHLYFIFHRAPASASASASASETKSSAYASQPLVATAALFAPFKMEPAATDVKAGQPSDGTTIPHLASHSDEKEASEDEEDEEEDEDEEEADEEVIKIEETSAVKSQVEEQMDGGEEDEEATPRPKAKKRRRGRF